jgi:hypothetical protein
MNQTWLVIRNPDGVYTWDLSSRDPESLLDLVIRARILTAVPCGDGWNLEPERVYDVAITSGEPHEKLGAIVSELGALDAVAPGLVTAYAESCRQETAQLQIAAAEQTLAVLSDEQVEQVIARRRGTAGPSSTKVSGGSSTNVRPA